jgi:hypothetical protein
MIAVSGLATSKCQNELHLYISYLQIWVTYFQTDGIHADKKNNHATQIERWYRRTARQSALGPSSNVPMHETVWATDRRWKLLEGSVPLHLRWKKSFVPWGALKGPNKAVQIRHTYVKFGLFRWSVRYADEPCPPFVCLGAWVNPTP